MQTRGIALCLLSACGFGAMAIFAKQAYAAGMTVPTLLSLRFVLAATLFWVLVAVRGAALPPRRVMLFALVLGAVGYAAQAGLYFGALTHLDASLTALLLYLYPSLVLVGAIALRREHATPSRLAALGLASTGTALVLLGGGLGAVDVLGLAMAFGAAVVYATYILAADRVVAAVDPFALAALVMTGAAASTVTAGASAGALHLGFAAGGWAWLLVLVCVSTVMGTSAFFAGLRRVGPATASIVSAAEPVVTVSLAALVYAERLGPGMVAGGILVLGAVVVLQWRAGGSVASDDAAPRTAAAAPARALAHKPA